MPGREWKRPGDGQSNGVEGQGSEVELPAIALSDAEVQSAITDLEIDFALDRSIRLSRTKGRPAETQSSPNPFSDALEGSGNLSLEDFRIDKRFLVCGLVSVLVGASLITFLVASTRLTFWFLIGTLTLGPIAVGVLAHAMGLKE